ncbi:MAG: hypothetical protein HKN45_12300, partial [Flavobacteriales bacterium]|nr:hypothetical protein [Flavobacteriales bacterium]
MKTKLILLAGLLCCNLLFTQTFSDSTSLLNYTSFYAPCVLDMNGDDLDDVVTFVSSGGIDMRIDYQQPDGTFSGQYFNINLPDAPSWSIAGGDLTGNGYNDLILGDGNSVTFVKANDTGTGYTHQQMVG